MIAWLRIVYRYMFERNPGERTIDDEIWS